MAEEIKKVLEEYFDRLWPINRSLTGNANRESLKILKEIIDLKISEIPSGTKCFDWIVPPEWNVKEAWVKDSSGKKIIDFDVSNLHLVGYSEAYHGKLSLSELKQHLYSLPDQPALIPYTTSYYKRRWGFCISHNQLQQLKNGEYEVFINSTLDDNGSMTIADAIIHGKHDKEILFTTYICHPSMANNELSGPLVSSFIYQLLKKREESLKYTYRFVFVPETIGSIYYLSKHGDHLKENLISGFVVTTAGDNGKFTYKRSRCENSLTNRAVETILRNSGVEYIVEDFFPMGSDERQYCSPGFNLPVGSLMRTRYGKYKEYHTSGDNKSFISFEAMAETIAMYLDVVELLENNYKPLNLLPYCEPQLGKRGLYPDISSAAEKTKNIEAIQWVLNYSDGMHDTIDIINKSKLKPNLIYSAIQSLSEAGLLRIE
ncbi:MAG: DUF4910 domain-containing protein [Ginsengibacter sp.]